MNWVDVDQYGSKDLAEVSIQIKRRTRMYSDLRIVQSGYWADGPGGVEPPRHFMNLQEANS